jgi:hypothetical protein
MSPSNKEVAGVSQGEWGRLEAIVEQFEEAWQKGHRPAIDDYLKAGEVEPRKLVIELAHADLECRLKAGEAVRVESYLERFANLAADREGVLGLIAAEYSFRQRQEPDLSIDEFERRFPQYRQDLPGRLQGPHQRPVPLPSRINCPH